ncbi:MAG: hypothetical protein PHT12_06200 [Patescibacteria group bacterium]|nr:hypothetical protein [Patescibacteria group bacterium]
MMESKESLKFDFKLVAAAICGLAMIFVALTQRNGALVAFQLYLLVVLAASSIYFGQQFIRILFMPVVAVLIRLEDYKCSRYFNKFDLNRPAEVVIFLAHYNWRTFEAWVKPNFFLEEIQSLVNYLNAKNQTFSFYPRASLNDVEEIMRDKNVKEVGFFGHGDSHVFCLSNDLLVFYCDFNDPKYAKEYAHQIHCGTPDGKSLLDYVVPKSNHSKCFFFRKSIRGRDIIKEFKRRAKEAAAEVKF